MRIGTFFNGGDQRLPAVIERVRQARDAGLDSFYFPRLSSWDPITLAAISAGQVPGIDIGTGVALAQPHHPLTMAAQALTVQAAAAGRFTLGLGLGHRQIIEGSFGYSYDRPARYMREYLTALQPLLAGTEIDFRGELLTAAGRVTVPSVSRPSVLVAALGPMMLRLAGELASGTITVWAGPEYLGEHIVPTIRRAAEAAGQPEPRVVATVLVALTADPDTIRDSVAVQFGAAADFASYRSLLDRQGMAGLAETVVAGDETEVAAAFRAFADAGVTELLVAPIGTPAEQARTFEFAATQRRLLA
ncbi:TIGR03564 family F420-dependent LLM class oxidoreductase [Actinoalloteichus hymeniacidonis]|uniref:F420-dependent oxidoreductase n=1 Tax=Actinoalloteichus hymeniacidonis TaxID=340345 RepID=A0AAC9MZQ7_9PSEU|nr:TIGR03564 family F420-dependent LLM class oxidoreductase [Actinoalloteichus hymeniacidonis]AOS64322.1 F420-dependent oxidoreductase [Actinoalloteichus hymeniacidonis]MBB5907610.1 F420-dependent oxidoreductase-like protein [Actinoalloteichus hymeniacidonis]